MCPNMFIIEIYFIIIYYFGIINVSNFFLKNYSNLNLFDISKLRIILFFGMEGVNHFDFVIS
jgi:hypothetical protein